VPEDRADVDDHWRSTLPEHWNRLAGQFYCSKEVHFENLPEHFGRTGSKVATRADPSVVDEQVEAAELSLGELKGGVPVSGIGNVTDYNARLASKLPCLGSHFGQPVTIPGNEQALDTLPRQLQRDRFANAP
jgi:hypothetical protein